MAGVAPEQSGGKWGRRSFDTPINLVPYIDLMTTIITFLIMTAVWTQIVALDVQNGASTVTTEEELVKAPSIVVLMSANAMAVGEKGHQPLVFYQTDRGFDFEAISNHLKKLQAEHPERIEVEISATDGVKYQSIAKMIDLSAGHGLVGVTLEPFSEN